MNINKKTIEELRAVLSRYETGRTSTAETTHFSTNCGAGCQNTCFRMCVNTCFHTCTGACRFGSPQ